MKFYFKFARKQLELTFFQYLVHDQGKDRRERGLKEREGTQLFGGRDHLTEGGNFQDFGHKWGASPDPPLSGKHCMLEKFQTRKTNEKTRKQLGNLIF